MNDYTTFLKQKRTEVIPSGFDVPLEDINPKGFLFQRDTVRWALRLGKAAIFANVGLGKTFMQLEFAKHVTAHTGRPALILAPLAVAPQTIKEGKKFDIEVAWVDNQHEVARYLASTDVRIFITNYDRVHLFDFTQFDAAILDESSILKHYSKTFFDLVERCKDIPYKLCCTATPAPNDFVELGNHAMFLDIMHFKDMLARWFIGEGDVARVARLKHYARADFWRWLTSWAVCISKPSDLGDQYDMPGYDLPPMHVHEYRLSASQNSIDRAWEKGILLPGEAVSATGFMQVKRDSLEERVEMAYSIVQSIDKVDPVILWCDTDFEADALLAAFPGITEVRGSQSSKHKVDGLTAFSEGRARMIITKPEIAGYGLNWQHCNQMIFTGSSFSFERPYQAIGRIHRFGQKRDANIHWIYSETEGNVMEILKTKQTQFAEMQAEMNAAMREHGLFREASNQTVFLSAQGTVQMYIPPWLKSHLAFVPPAPLAAIPPSERLENASQPEQIPQAVREVLQVAVP